MNLNKKIKKFTGDGIPAYNEKFNELIDVANWLLGVRTINGKTIAESDQGPIIDLSQVNTTQPANDPSATDPDGNRAGWRKITLIDTIAGNYFDIWAWSGAVAMNIRPVPWFTDPSGIGANWIVCVDNTFWGTGQCPTGGTCVNYRASAAPSNNGGNSPYIVTYLPSTPPIVPPASCTPRFYLEAYQFSDQGFQGPVYPIAGPNASNFAYTLSVTYDGVAVFSVSGTASLVSGVTTYIPMPLSGWLFDPGNLPGYSKGSHYWIYQFNGNASPNTNPPIVLTFTHNAPVVVGHPLNWLVVFMQGS